MTIIDLVSLQHHLRSLHFRARLHLGRRDKQGIVIHPLADSANSHRPPRAIVRRLRFSQFGSCLRLRRAVDAKQCKEVF